MSLKETSRNHYPACAFKGCANGAAATETQQDLEIQKARHKAEKARHEEDEARYNAEQACNHAKLASIQAKRDAETLELFRRETVRREEKSAATQAIEVKSRTTQETKELIERTKQLELTKIAAESDVDHRLAEAKLDRLRRDHEHNSKLQEIELNASIRHHQHQREEIRRKTDECAATANIASYRERKIAELQMQATVVRLRKAKALKDYEMKLIELNMQHTRVEAELDIELIALNAQRESLLNAAAK